MADETDTIPITDLIPDPENPNEGTERGQYMMDYSLRNLGAGRSILLDKHNRIIAGNKTFETAGQLGIDKVRVVDSDGSVLVAVRRNDLDLDEEAGRLMSYADNRTAQINLSFVPQVVTSHLEKVNLDGLFRPEELLAIGQKPDFLDAYIDARGDLDPETERGFSRENPYVQLQFPATADQRDTVLEALADVRQKYDLATSTDALLKLCELYYEGDL